MRAMHLWLQRIINFLRQSVRPAIPQALPYLEFIIAIATIVKSSFPIVRWMLSWIAVTWFFLTENF